MNCGLRISDCGLAGRRLRHRRRGFSFTEVLFAVMILGVGFIMVAAIFPVAIQQAQTSTEETTGAAVSRGAINYLEKVATNSTMPGTNDVVVAGDFDGVAPPDKNTPDHRDTYTLAGALRGSIVIPSDPRYAWVPFYRRSGNPRYDATWGPFAQVILIPVLMRAESDYGGLGGPAGNPMPKGGPIILQDKTGLPGTAVVRGNLIDGVAGAADTMVFETEPGVASEGAFVIIADASAVGGSTLGPVIAPHLNGRVYRLGNRVDGTTDTWELMPGYDLQPVRIDANGVATDGAPPTPRDGREVVAGGPAGAAGTVDLNDVMFFVVGRSLDPNVPAGTERTGTAQDVSAYSTFINVN